MLTDKVKTNTGGEVTIGPGVVAKEKAGLRMPKGSPGLNTARLRTFQLRVQSPGEGSQLNATPCSRAEVERGA